MVENVDQNSYDHFDALSHLGRIYYAQGRWDDAAATLEKAVQPHHFNENEYIVDTWFWIARSHLKRNDPPQARGYLEKIAATDVQYEKKPQASRCCGRLPKQHAFNRPTERRRGGLRRAGAAGSAGWPSLNARLSPEWPVSRPHVLRQALPAVPARRRPPGRFSFVGGLSAVCLDRRARLPKRAPTTLARPVVRVEAARIRQDPDARRGDRLLLQSELRPRPRERGAVRLDADDREVARRVAAHLARQRARAGHELLDRRARRPPSSRARRGS